VAVKRISAANSSSRLTILTPETLSARVQLFAELWRYRGRCVATKFAALAKLPDVIRSHLSLRNSWNKCSVEALKRYEYVGLSQTRCVRVRGCRLALSRRGRSAHGDCHSGISPLAAASIRTSTLPAPPATRLLPLLPDRFDATRNQSDTDTA